MRGLEATPLERALERAGDGVVTIGADDRIRMWNPTAERLLGYTAQEVIGRRCCDVFMGRDDSDNLVCYAGCQVRSLATLGDSIKSFDMRARTKAGHAVWINVSTLVARTERSEGAIIVHLFRDITATKELLRLVHERLAGAANGEAGLALTRREVEVLRLMAAGLSTRAVAARLSLSVATVRNHMQNVLAKFGVHSRLEAVAHATRHRLL